MESLMVVADYVEARNFRGDSFFPTDGLVTSPTSCRALGNEFTPLTSLPAMSTNAPSQALPLWNAAAVLNKALYALKFTKQPLNFPGAAKDCRTSAADSSPTALLRFAETTTKADDATPQHVLVVLLTDESTISSEDCCTLSSASCSRRSGARRSNDNFTCADSPAERGSANTTTTTTDSPFCSASSPFSPRGKRSSSKSAAQSSPGSTSLLLCSAASTPSSPAPSSSSPLPAAKTVGQAASASIVLMRKAISGPLERAGVLSKCKEKLE